MVTMPGGWQGRDVLVTGHTGFKGGWLCLWLHLLGARVHGYALEPPTRPNLFDAFDLGGLLASDTRADLADLAALRDCLVRSRASVVFHLAAQSLVRESYAAPLPTFATNVMGTAHLLQAARESATVRAVVVATTDKVYENHETGRAFREGDALGGNDPYSASKAACEIVAASFRASFFGTPGSPCLATARAGNVIGGGDWAGDRLVPDCLRAFAAGRPVHLRYPGAVRPWQHVLEPLGGYLRLAGALLTEDGPRFARAWNFGPAAADDATVHTVAQRLAGLWGGAAAVTVDAAEHPHEAGLLRLDSGAAARELDWRPRWSLEQALAATVAWHQAWHAGSDMREVGRAQLRDYAPAGVP
nr:CDP-glucose 4,6-dehydratase [Tahibacter caeni]